MDQWEMTALGSLTNTPGGDFDGDNVSNWGEYLIDTDPDNTDSDGDGLSDGDEVNTYKSHPGSCDSDRDGIDDAEDLCSNLDPLAA